MIKLLDRLVHMGQNANLRLFGQSSKVLKLLSRKDRVIFWGLVTLRFLVNLLDLAGIALLALAVNFLIADPNTKSFFSPFFELLSVKTDASGSKLPALFAIGLIVVTTFIVKAVASLLLMAKSAEQISNRQPPCIPRNSSQGGHRLRCYSWFSFNVSENIGVAFDRFFRGCSPFGYIWNIMFGPAFYGSRCVRILRCNRVVSSSLCW